MRPESYLALAMTLLSAVSTDAETSPDTQPLGGSWRFQIDRENRGVAERWFERSLQEAIELPGSMPGQGRGDPVTLNTPWTGSLFDKAYFTQERYAPYRQPGNIKVPFWLQPETYYSGVAWYQRDLDVPANWQVRRVVLTLERPHWATQVWLDGRLIGGKESLSTPHEYELGVGLAPGRHTLSIRVDNGRVVDIGENSHSVSDHTQGNWNGIVGQIALSTTAPVWIEDLQVYPELEPKRVRVTGRVARTGAADLPRRVALHAEVAGANLAERWLDVATDGTFQGEYPLPADAALWDEFEPTLHRIVARPENGDSRSTRFGLRSIGRDGRQLLLNGRPLFIRATLECAIFPKTGHPPTDVESWRRILRIARAHGLNSLRFHSWCPPEAAFVAGDEMGFYFQIEAASWPNWSTTLGEGQPVDRWIEEETKRILHVYGNHPSFVLMASGNEPGGADGPRDAFLAAWVKRHSASDPRRLFTGASAWPILKENQYLVHSTPRIQQWGEELKSRINALPPATTADYSAFIAGSEVPVISHEIGQWCVFPDLDEMPQYTGYLKPRNFEIFRDTLERNRLGQHARAFLHASGKLQALCYKEDIESALRTPRMGGFQLLDLHDFPGQGTALVGVLNPFWESKGYISAEEFRRFCHSTVPLARLPQRVFTTADTFTARCEVANYGRGPLEAAPMWRLVTDDGKEVAAGRLPTRTLPVGLSEIGEVSVPLASVRAAARLKFVLGLQGTDFENDWDIWVYPEARPEPADDQVLVAQAWNENVERRLAIGGRVLLTLAPEQVRNDGPDPVKLGFSSIFWNTAWTNRQAPTTLGILCDPSHPALAQFPTEAHSNWQWWYVITQAAPLRLDGLPQPIEPVIRVIDDWVTSRSLGLAIEAKVGGGRLLVTSVDLRGELDPVRRQLRHSLLTYMSGDSFAPRTELSAADVTNLLQQ